MRTNYTEQILSWEANSSHASQIPHGLYKHMVY